MKNRLFVSASVVLGAVLGLLSLGAGAVEDSGYVTDSRGYPIKSGAGLCWRTGYWTPSMATSECDPDLAKHGMVDKAPVEKSMRKREVPTAGPVTPATLALSADGLFEFGKSKLLPESKDKLDVIVAKLHAGKFSKITVVGHTDRIGSKKRNQHISKERAESVKAFFVSKGVDGSRIAALGKGSSEPKTAPGQCKGKKSPKLIACLQPDRRVEITVTP